MKREYINFYKRERDNFFMVRIVDITEEKERKKEQAKLEREIIEECFVGRRIIFVERFSASIFEEGRKLALKYFGQGDMLVYDEDVLEEAKEFARRYEEQFSPEEDFVITTDYCKNGK